jgi:hypothetical protein
LAAGAYPSGNPVAPSRPDGTSIDRPRQPGAEHRVDHDVGSVNFRRRERNGGAEPEARRTGRVGSLARRGKGGQTYRPTVLSQEARRNVPVAAVVAWPRQDERPAAPDVTLNRTGDGTAGGLHQLGAGVTVPCRRLVSLAHLDGGKEVRAAVQPVDQVRVKGRGMPSRRRHRRNPADGRT